MPNCVQKIDGADVKLLLLNFFLLLLAANEIAVR